MNKTLVYIGLSVFVLGLILALISTAFSVTGDRNVKSIDLSFNQKLYNEDGCQDARIMYSLNDDGSIAVHSSEPFSIPAKLSSYKRDFTAIYDGTPETLIARFYCADTNSYLSSEGTFSLGGA